MIKAKIFFRILSASSILLAPLSFVICLTSCTQARLSTISQQQVYQAKADGAFCSAPALQDGDINNMIFIVDMSGSNVRKIDSVKQTYTRSGATDITGARFQLMRNFLNTSCAQTNSKNRFAVIGFSATVLGSSGICNSQRLSSRSGVIDQIANLEDAQKREPLDPPTAMQDTEYQSGINCASSIIQSDIASQGTDSQKQSYSVFFLSDGGPTSPGGNLLSNSPSDLNPVYSTVSSLMGLTNQTAGVSFQPILYGADILKQQSQSEYDLAITVMTRMAQIGNTIQDAVTDPTKINICDLLNSGKRTPFMVTDFGIINLTATMQNGELLADSDMDGIPDKLESARGFDPTTPRSMVNGNEAIDGTCKLQAKDCVPQTNCGKPNALGLTRCEATMYSMTDGLDSDNDGLPDLVEYLKGTNVSDPTDKTNDVDGDGVTNTMEVHFGRDPNFWDNNVSKDLLLSYHHDLSRVPLGSCPEFQQSWSFHIENIPLVPTLATHINDPISLQTPFFSHEENENVIFVYYIVRQTNDSLQSPGFLYGQFIKMAPGQSLRLGAFQRLGVINGHFQP